MVMPPLGEILPHRPPMVLLDGILSYEPPEITCGVTIHESSMFAAFQGVPAIVSLEYMAQCAAAYSGMQKRERGEAPKVGYLLGTRHIELRVEHLLWGEQLVVRAHHHWGEGGLASFECEVRCDRQLLAIATLSVYEGALPH